MNNREKNFVSVVIYVHNNQDEIGEFVKDIITLIEKNFDKSEIICVNDFSTDMSCNKIKEASKVATETSVSILNMSSYHGLETAMNAGVDLAIGDFVYEFDTVVRDYDLEEIMRIYRTSLEGYDIVSASPQKKQRLSSTLFYKVFAKNTNSGMMMRTETFRIMSRRVINRINAMNTSIPYRKAVYANCGLKTKTVTYEVVDRTHVKHNREERQYRMDVATDALIIFTNVGYRFSVFMTGLMMVIALFMAIYSIAIYCTSTPVTGWTTTILFLSCAFFGLFGILTIMIKYLQILVGLVFKRKRYNFESIEKLTK